MATKRWEQQVVKAGCYNDVTGPYTIKLLTRQHAAFVRMVKFEVKKLQPVVCKERHSSFLRGKLVAYSDILAALKKQGGKK